MWPLWPRPRPWRSAWALQRLLDKPAADLTVAGRKRLELARALATQPKLLLLDEVLAGLNPQEIGEMMPVVRGIAQSGVTVLMIEHVMQAVMNLARARVGAGAGAADRAGIAGRGHRRPRRDRGLSGPWHGGQAAPAGCGGRRGRRMTALLDIQGLRGGYGAVEVLRGVDLHVDEGEIVALLGSNGAGKSTLNNVLCGIYPAWAGRVVFDGQDLSGAHYRDVVKAGLIQVPEGRKIFPNLSVLENLELGSFTRARERRAQNLERVFATFPRLKERIAQLAGTMSGGEQQMLAIGRGLMAEPRLLILDEPSLGLSPLLVEEMFTLIGQLNREGLAVLLVEQNVGQSLEVAQRAYVLENGAVRFSGSGAELLASDVLRLAYLGV